MEILQDYSEKVTISLSSNKYSKDMIAHVSKVELSVAENTKLTFIF